MGSRRGVVALIVVLLVGVVVVLLVGVVVVLVVETRIRISRCRRPGSYTHLSLPTNREV